MALALDIYQLADPAVQRRDEAEVDYAIDVACNQAATSHHIFY